MHAYNHHMPESCLGSGFMVYVVTCLDGFLDTDIFHVVSDDAYTHVYNLQNDKDDGTDFKL